MFVEEMQTKIDSLFVEAEIIDVSCNNFSKDVKIIYGVDGNNTEKIQYHFSGCIKVEFFFLPSDEEINNVDEKTRCYLQRVIVKDFNEDVKKWANIKGGVDIKTKFYKCYIDMYPLEAKILFANMKLNRIMPDGTIIEV